MAKQTINIGAVPNDGTGDPLRDAFDKCNDNFNELYSKQIRRNLQTGLTYGVVSSDADDGITVVRQNAAANTITLPLNSNQAIDVDKQVEIISIGAGQTTIDVETGVTINGVVDGSVVINTQYQGAVAWKFATDEWIVIGDVT